MKLLALILLTPLAFAQLTPETQALLNQAQTAMQTRHVDEAIKSLKQALKQQAACAVCEFKLAEAYQTAQDYSAAQKAADRYLAQVSTPKEQSPGHNLKGLIYSSEALHKESLRSNAVAEFQNALALNPSPTVRYNLGIELEKMGRDPEAAVELQKVADDPSASTQLKQLAQTYIKEPRRAREFFLPDFTVETADGRTLTTADLKGKVVLLDFWATWCGPCRASLPDVKSTYKRFSKDKFVLISISIDDDQEKWKAFIAKENMDWTQVIDKDHKLTRLFDAHSIPRYFVVDAEGIIHKMVIGEGNFQSIAVHEEIKKALKTLDLKVPDKDKEKDPKVAALGN